MELTTEMLSLLKSLEGKILNSIICNYESAFKRTFGNLRLCFDDCSVEIENDLHQILYRGECEEMTGFTCKKAVVNSVFTPYAGTRIDKININMELEHIDVIKDEIFIDEKKELTFDAAIVFRFPFLNIMLSRDVWFSETINITENDNYDLICSIDKIIESFSGEGENNISVLRTQNVLF